MKWDVPIAPIELPDGSKLRTLADCRDFIGELPKHELRSRAWTDAITSLETAAERGGGSVSIARAAFLKAMHPERAKMKHRRRPR
jgi:hypothetical protein